jgi:hypothetical protein
MLKTAMDEYFGTETPAFIPNKRTTSNEKDV